MVTLSSCSVVSAITKDLSLFAQMFRICVSGTNYFSPASITARAIDLLA